VNADRVADFLVLAESFQQLDELDTYAHATPHARLLDLDTEELSRRYQPLNAAMPAYPGGTFFEGPYPETHDTQVYHNSVVVFPVERALLGIDGADRVAYRGVSGMGRRYTITGEDPPTPADTTAWVDLAVDASPIALEGTLYDSPLFPDDDGELSLTVAPGEAPSLLVLHHTNGESAHHQIVELEAIEGSNLAIAGEPRGATTALFTVTNDDGSARRGVTLSLTASGANILSVDSSLGDCTVDGCALGDLAAGETATATVSLERAGASVTATVASELGCETAPQDDSVTVLLQTSATAGEGEVEGCGCRLAPRSRAGWAWLAAAAALLAARRRRNAPMQPSSRASAPDTAARATGRGGASV
jgi:MYXO-CTERM domain-containing protein